MDSRIIIAIVIIGIGTFSLTPAFANFVEFQDIEFGFSIQYPEDWYYDDEIIEYETTPGSDDGFYIMLYFYDDPNFLIDSIEVSLTKNSNIARNNQGHNYLERVESRLAEFCETAVMEIEGYECSNFTVTDTKITEHKGLPAYQFIQTWTESYPDGTSLELKSNLIDIVNGNDVWTIDGITLKSEFPEFIKIFDKAAESFTLRPVDESTQKIPEWVRNIFVWYAEDQVSEDELIGALQFLVKEGVIKLD